eukprot:227334_1
MAVIWLIITYIMISISLSKLNFDGTFEVQSYHLDEETARRHTTAILSENTLHLVGGFGRFGPSNPNFKPRRNVYSLNLEESNPEWKFLNNIPSDQISEPWFTSTRGLLEINNKFYMACHDKRDGKIYTFNDQDGTFSELSIIPNSFDVTEDCCAIGVTINNDNRIYITGGVMPTNNNPTDQIIYYSINQNKWFQIDSLNTPRSHHACVAVPNANELYVLGGVNRTSLEVLSSIEVYDISNNKWTQFDNILDPGRRSFGAITFTDEENDFILLIGGDIRSPGDPNGASPLNLVQLFNVNTHMIVTGLVIPQLNFGRVSPGTAFGVFECDDNNDGGYSDSDDSDSIDDDIICFSVFVISGQGIDGSGTSLVRTDTERLDFKITNSEQSMDFAAKNDGYLYDMDKNKNMEEHVINVNIDKSIWISVWCLFGVIVVVGALCYFYNFKKTI